MESTVTLLRSAAQQGGEIVAINSSNLISTLPNLTLPAEVLEDIRSAVAGGLLAITTAAPVTDIEYPDFSGVGYILLDKETGSSAFLVSGGTNGAIQKLRYEVQSCGPLVASTNIMIAQASDCPGGEDWLDKLASTLSSVAGGAIDTLSGIKGILDTLSDCLRSIAAPQNAQQAIFSVSVIVTWLILAALLLFGSLAGPVAFVVGLALTASLEFALDCET